MGKLLEVKDLKVSFHTYAGEVQSVRGVSFDLDKGETLAIVGESGCGKTITSKSIMRLIPMPPGEIKKESQILFEGKDILKMSDKELRQLRGESISMIFQDPMTSLNPTMNIGNQIAESLIIHRGMNKKEALEEAVKMLKLVNIPNAEKRVNQYPHEFSGGMRQRAMIAIALACNPKILIADEPTTALDVTIQAQIMDLIKELQNKLGTAVILITHDLGVVASVASKIQVMYAGKIIERGTTDEIFFNAKHPYTWALLQSVPRLDTKHKNELYSIQGTPPDLLKPPVGCPFASRCEYCMQICKEEMPEVTKVSDTHNVLCWLQHPLAPKVEAPIVSGGAK
ncbi:oligopeptide transport system ATP-binding protein [Clostridium tetanomorphum]|uniref:ABC transporter ATP-binding protein n=2 Tax=Clostridium TaxID=1485 RepID=A0A923J202_CLOTT|nr:ABC transporter ATP-binding protein [Clostridium tetanomorphum]KAJ52759.1 oligopeptide/dipeptide ABC transporter ATP-binding protein [Clostridium tetanomorphum DSM 665]MBC2398230.1 ABC transporter ATP-binding protein [Clostridium tetanomorphum]MBP1865651.1 oligopeptide transport system ATP-binding protein [Clostridium tetanomorphum]NRS85843.1 oligopeptide transport system ATP-binding protein [Clostridium tetanomorphum]NRZ96149.1 oligopeptide transport system ATP-binding protein [Clostridium